MRGGSEQHGSMAPKESLRGITAKWGTQPGGKVVEKVSGKETEEEVKKGAEMGEKRESGEKGL